MRCGIVLPGGTVPHNLELAMAAEKASWEAASGVDAWTLLGAAANTSHVRLATMLTPLPWRRPWRVASQAATLEQPSGGRAILAVGMGAVATGQGQTGEFLDARERAAMPGEGIDLLRTLWRLASQTLAAPCAAQQRSHSRVPGRRVDTGFSYANPCVVQRQRGVSVV